MQMAPKFESNAERNAAREREAWIWVNISYRSYEIITHNDITYLTPKPLLLLAHSHSHLQSKRIASLAALSLSPSANCTYSNKQQLNLRKKSIILTKN